MNYPSLSRSTKFSSGGYAAANFFIPGTICEQEIRVDLHPNRNRNVAQTDNSTPYLSRHVGHLSGLDATVPALTVNRLCGSGFQTVINAAQTIALGEAEVCLTGGAEAMSMSPYTLSGASR